MIQFLIVANLLSTYLFFYSMLLKTFKEKLCKIWKILYRSTRKEWNRNEHLSHHLDMPKNSCSKYSKETSLLPHFIIVTF